MPEHIREPVGPVDGRKVPRFAGSASFARLPEIDRVSDYDVAVLGAPFDSGVSYRPGARFGPMAVRQASRHLRPGHHVELDCSPFAAIQVVDAGTCRSRRSRSMRPWSRSPRPPRTCCRATGRSSPSAAITRSRCRCCGRWCARTARSRWCTSTRTWTPGTPTSTRPPRTAPSSGGRLRSGSWSRITRSMSASAAPSTSRSDLDDDLRFGFRTIRASDIDVLGVGGAIEAITERVADLPVYLSIDIDVLDPRSRRAPDAGGGRAQQPGTAARAARPDQPQPGQRRPGRGVARLRPRGDHRLSPPPR